MSSQFFKDIHGANSRFVPRSFSLNLGGSLANATHTSGSSLNNVSNGEDSNDSSVHPQGGSTAPSTSASSNFFSAVVGGKVQPSKRDISFFDEGSSVVENVFQANNGNSDRQVQEISDPDIEITDIKEVSQAPDTTQQSDQSSIHAFQELPAGDFMMDALVKSQRVCNALKAELKSAQSKIQSQDDELQNQKSAIIRMKVTFKSFKDNMAAMQSKSLELSESRLIDNHTIANLKLEYSEALKHIDAFKHDVSTFKKKIDHLKQIKTSSAYEVDNSMLIPSLNTMPRQY